MPRLARTIVGGIAIAAIMVLSVVGGERLLQGRAQEAFDLEQVVAELNAHAYIDGAVSEVDLRVSQGFLVNTVAYDRSCDFMATQSYIKATAYLSLDELSGVDAREYVYTSGVMAVTFKFDRETQEKLRLISAQSAALVAELSTEWSRQLTEMEGEPSFADSEFQGFKQMKAATALQQRLLAEAGVQSYAVLQHCSGEEFIASPIAPRTMLLVENNIDLAIISVISNFLSIR